MKKGLNGVGSVYVAGDGIQMSVRDRSLCENNLSLRADDVPIIPTRPAALKYYYIIYDTDNPGQ